MREKEIKSKILLLSDENANLILAFFFFRSKFSSIYLL